MKLLDDAGSLEENNIKDIFCFTVPRMRRKVRDIGYYNYNLFPLLTITACFSLASFSFFFYANLLVSRQKILGQSHHGQQSSGTTTVRTIKSLLTVRVEVTQPTNQPTNQPDAAS